MNLFLVVVVVVIPLLLIWGTGLSLAAAARWLWRGRPLPPPDPDAISGPYGFGESFLVLLRRMTWEEIVSATTWGTLSLAPPLVALAGVLAWRWPKWSLFLSAGSTLWMLWQYNARELLRTASPRGEERRFVVHPVGAEQPAGRHGGRRRPADLPRLFGQYAEVALCHVWRNNLLLWLDEQPVILRGVRKIRREEDGAGQVVAGRLCLPWNGIKCYSTAYYRQGGARMVRVFWMEDTFPNPDQETLRLGAGAPLITLSPEAPPPDAPPAPAARFVPAGGEWWARHVAGRAFCIRGGDQTLGGEDAPQVRFHAAFWRPGSWVEITEADDILLLYGISGLEAAPEGGLTCVGGEEGDGARLRVCLDHGGVRGSTECVVADRVYLRSYSLTPSGAREGNEEEAAPRVSLAVVD